MGGGTVTEEQEQQQVPARPRGHHEDEPEPKVTRVPTGVDVFGRHREYVEVPDPEAASQWDTRCWQELP